MTYIKWKDEVESYLGNLSADEKQKIFSYFAEMYADKRDAGKSEAQIIEEFGAPYDVAKRILADNKENIPTATEGGGNPAGVNGGNNYNYNYYNYNYGGSPQQPQQPPTQQQVQKPPFQKEPYADGIPTAEIPAMTPPENKRKSVTHVIISVVLAILLTGLTIFCIGAPVLGIVQGFGSMATALGALAAGKGSAGLVVLSIGYGLINVGGSFLILAPFSALVKYLWKKLKAFM